MGSGYTAADKVVYNIKLPASVTKIGNLAFANTNTDFNRRSYYKTKYNIQFESAAGQ